MGSSREMYEQPICPMFFCYLKAQGVTFTDIYWLKIE